MGQQKDDKSEEQKKVLEVKKESYAKQLKQRKRIAESIIDAISENSGIAKKKLMVFY